MLLLSLFSLATNFIHKFIHNLARLVSSQPLIGGRRKVQTVLNEVRCALELSQAPNRACGCCFTDIDHNARHTLLRRSKEILPSKSLIYLDPPYYVKGQGLYRNYYEHSDHEAIAKLLLRKSFPRRWVVSYDDVAAIRAMYEGSQRQSYALHYTAQRRYTGSEIMFFCNHLAVPGGLVAAA